MRKDKVLSFLWQHLLLIISLFIMTSGVALCVRSALGSSVISTIPYVLTLAGQYEFITALTIGEWTYIMNFIFVGVQVIILRKQFECVQLFQLLIGFLFGWLLDLNMMLTEIIPINTLPAQIIAQLMGCVVLGIGISFEVKCGSVTMPGEGMPIAIARKTGAPFAKVKIVVDITLVAIAVLTGYLFFNKWLWEVVGPGTLFAMVFVGAIVKLVTPRIRWFDTLLCYRPGFRRYVYGLAKYLRHLYGSK